VNIDARFMKVPEPAEQNSFMALLLLLPTKLVVVYIKASYLEGERGEPYEGLPCTYTALTLWAHSYHSHLRKTRLIAESLSQGCVDLVVMGSWMT
jgi:hypothetical protein